MHRSQFQGVILAAGRGSRLQPLNHSHPKSLLPICNRPLIAYQLELMQALDISEVFIVCGHLKDALQQESEKQNSTGLTLTFVEQRHPLGIAHALGCVEPYINKPFVVFLGDIFVVAPQISQLIQKYGRHMPCSLLAVRDEDDEHLIGQNYNVLLQENGQVHQVIEKPKRAASKCKGCGLYVFDPAIFEAIRRTPQTAMRNEFELTTSIQIHIDDGFPVYPFERIDWDCNINSIEDFHLCNMAELQRRGKNAVYGHKCRIHPKASIGNTVLGNEVVIASPICIQHSVILSNTEISTDHDLKHVIGTPDRIIPVQNSNLPQTLN
jgi:dTDP-glucose pyrophosphorylase